MVCPVAKAPCGLGNCVLRSAVEISASLEQKAVPWPQAVLTWHFQEPRHEDGIGQATLQPAEISDHGVNSPRPLKTVSGETTQLVNSAAVLTYSQPPTCSYGEPGIHTLVEYRKLCPCAEQAELDDILQRLREDGQEPGATADERLRHLWRVYLRSEGSLRALTQDLEEVRLQQVAEMKEVENYVDHIRNLSEEREALTAEYERENEQLRGELQQLRLEQEAHLKEVEEMLDQEGLAEISHSSPSEQIAYLLVERATLLEKLESAERKLDSQSYTGSLREEELDQIRQTLEEELRQQRESMQRTKETMNKVSDTEQSLLLELRGGAKPMNEVSDTEQSLLLELRGGAKTMNKVSDTEQSLLLELKGGAKTMNEVRDTEQSLLLELRGGAKTMNEVSDTEQSLLLELRGGAKTMNEVRDTEQSLLLELRGGAKTMNEVSDTEQSLLLELRGGAKTMNEVRDTEQSLLLELRGGAKTMNELRGEAKTMNEVSDTEQSLLLQLRGEAKTMNEVSDTEQSLLLQLRGEAKTMNEVSDTEQSLLLQLRGEAKTMNETHDAELSSERRRRECAERDLDEASRRLSMAHEEIRRLTDELDIARKTSSDPGLQRARQEVEQLRVEVEELKESDLLELQRVKEHNVRLDKEILSLRSRVRLLDSERKTLLQTVEKLKEEVQQNQVRETVSEVESLPLQLDQTEPKLLSQDRATASLTQAACAGDTENNAHQQIHERCRQELQDRGCQVQELHRKLLKLQREHEELGERNEELESILGETQNRTKEERERFESETEGLHRKITGLDAELSRLRKKQQQWEGKGVAVPSSEMSDAEQALQQQLKSSRDREAVLEGCLTEEKEWRKQLEADLSAAQSALKKSKEDWQSFETQRQF
ncbi:UNVERIFIED_CONTAM: hypothetical protein FKN15_053573 [Acipenser sinensis]